MDKKQFMEYFTCLLSTSVQPDSHLNKEWAIKEGEYFYKMKAPSVNDQQKYLKLDNEDETVVLFKTLILGDLTSIFIKKLGDNGFVFYLDKCPDFDEKIKNNTVLKWMR